MKDDLRWASRSFRRNPGFTIVAVLILALGIGANTAVFSVIHAVLLRPLPYAEPERLVTLWESNPELGFDHARVSPANFLDWQARNQVFASMAFSPAWVGSRSFLLLAGETTRVAGAYVSSGLFPLLGVRPILGRTFSPEEDRREGNRVAILGYGLWQRVFGGDREILGKAIIVDSYSRRQFVVVGVMPPAFDFPAGAELWLPAGWMGVRMDRRAAHWLQVFARLRSGVTLEQARTEMDAIAAGIATEHPEARVAKRVRIVPLLDEIVGSVRPALLVSWAAAGLLLLITCANMANLLLARAAGREREIAIRAALGAGRRRLARQLLTESLLLALAGGTAGAVLAAWGTQGLAALAAERIPRLTELRADASLLGFSLMFSVATGLIFGLLPAMHASRPNLFEALKEGGTSSAGIRRRRLRGLLVVAEVALALVLLDTAGLLGRSLLELLGVDPGFRPENLLTARLDMSSSGYTTTARPGRNRPQVFTQRVIERIRALPGVELTGAVDELPIGPSGTLAQTFAIEGHTARTIAEYPTARNRAVTPEYFRAMGIPLLQGRYFREDETEAAPPVVIINQTLARQYFPGENPAGKRLDIGVRERLDRDGTVRPHWQEIVGVVGDVCNDGLGGVVLPEIYKPYFQWAWHSAYLAVRSSAEPQSLAAAIRREVHVLNPEQPVDRFRTGDLLLSEATEGPRFRALLVGLFGLVALVLTTAGIYGVLAYTTAERTREVGIRMALGAGRREILKLVLGQGLRLSARGLALGLGISVVVVQLLAPLLYGVKPNDVMAVVSAVLVITVAALAACYLPARRATRIDPAAALRRE